MNKLRISIFVFLIIMASPTLADINGDLIEAVKSGDSTTVESLLAQGADINYVATDESEEILVFTPLIYAVMRGDVETTEQLIAHKADLDMFPFNHTALIMAVRKKHHEIAELLLEAGADPNFFSDRSLHYAPLWSSAVMKEYADVEMVKLLLDHGAKPRKVYFDEDKRTLLDFVCRSYVNQLRASTSEPPKPGAAELADEYYAMFAPIIEAGDTYDYIPRYWHSRYEICPGMPVIQQ